jgi:hypothetical protein
MNMQETPYARAPAKRIFAQELQESNLTQKEGDDQYSPQYLITPTGAKINRVYITGTLIEKEDIGSDMEYWRARITDPTGVFLVYAGQYQPEAADTLARTETPAFVAVIGKPSIYTTPEGTTVTSIRPESIHTISEDIIDQWIIDTAQQTLQRLKNNSHPSAQQASAHYSTEPSRYREMILTALAALS